MMTVLFKILAVAGWLVLAVLLLLLWLVLVPRRFKVEYSKKDGLNAAVRVVFFDITLYPLPKFLEQKDRKKDTAAEPAESRKNGETGEKAKEGPFSDIQFSFELVKQTVIAAKGIMKRVFRALKFSDVSFIVPVYAGSIHNTQKAYSAVTSSFYSLSVFLQKNLQFYYKSPVFVADFANRYSDATYFYCKITASPVLLLTAAYFAYTQYISITTDNRKAQAAPEKEIKNG